MSSPVGPEKPPISAASAAPPSAIFEVSTDRPVSSGSSKLPKDKEATVTINKPDAEESVSSPASAGSRPSSCGGDPSTKLPPKAKPRPSKAAPKASAATKKALNLKVGPSNDAPKATTATKKAPRARKVKLPNGAPKASTGTKKAPTAPKAKLSNDTSTVTKKPTTAPTNEPSKTTPMASTSTEKAPTALKATPSDTVSVASPATEKAPTDPGTTPSDTAPIVSTATEKAPTAPKAKPCDSVPVASVTTEKVPTAPKAAPSATAPIASATTEKASTAPKATSSDTVPISSTAPKATPSDTVPVAPTATKREPTARKNKPSNTAPKATPSDTAPIASTATKAPPNLPQSPHSDAMDDSDTDYIESDSAAKKGTVEVFSPESASLTSSRSTSPIRPASSSHLKNPSSSPKSQGIGAIKKRRRTTTSLDATPAKRIRSTPHSRAAPRATYNAASLVGEFTNFTTSIFIVQLGPENGPNCPKFHVHESVLVRSPIFAHDIEVAKKAKTLTKQNILAVFPHDPVAFEQMLQYLYKDTFILRTHTKSPLEARLNEIHELFSLAKHYVLPGLQKQVVKAFSQSRMVGKVPVNRFFDWSEDMYYEELDKEKGPFRAFFARVAPGLVKKMKGGDVSEIAKIVGQGGGFAGEIFKAMYAALELETRKTVVKKEERSLAERKLFPEVLDAHETEEGFVDITLNI